MHKSIKTGIAVAVMSALCLTATLPTPAAYADNDHPPRKGKISGKTVLGGALSLLVWPGIGQAINDNRGAKVATHAVAGLLPPFRFWSAYDALVDRSGGYFDGKI